MYGAACASTNRAPHTHQFLIDFAAIRNARNFHKNNALAFSKRLKFARSGAVSSQYQPPVTNHEAFLASSHARFSQLLIATQILEIKPTRSQQTRKHFLIATFSGNSAPAPHLSHHSPLITRCCLVSFLFDTNERTRKKPNPFTRDKKQFLFRTFERLVPVLFNTFERSSIYPFLPPTRHGRIAAL